MNAYQKIAAGLMMVSGISQPSQLLIYGADPDVRWPVLCGIVYLLVGLGLRTGRKIAIWFGIILPLLGGIDSVYRILALEPTPLTYFLTMIDFVVVALCVAVLAIDWEAAQSGEDCELG